MARVRWYPRIIHRTGLRNIFFYLDPSKHSYEQLPNFAIYVYNLSIIRDCVITVTNARNAPAARAKHPHLCLWAFGLVCLWGWGQGGAGWAILARGCVLAGCQPRPLHPRRLPGIWALWRSRRDPSQVQRVEGAVVLLRVVVSWRGCGGRRCRPSCL